MSNMGGPINFLTHSNGYIFFFAGATAPPRDNVAPPLSIYMIGNISPFLLSVRIDDIPKCWIYFFSFGVSNGL